jgi:pimeloyl-ACP methyl ester carboxylesterase
MQGAARGIKGTGRRRRGGGPDLVVAFVLATAAFATGCAAPSLVSEDELAPHAGLKQSWLDQPVTTHRVPTYLTSGPVVEVAVHETGPPACDHMYVLLHGVFADHRAWRFVAGALSPKCRVMLVDLPGCGDSDRPAPAALGPGGYAPDALAERTLQAIDARLAYAASAGRAPSRLTIVAHSLGGAVALRMTGSATLRRRYASVVGSIEGLVLFSPADIEFSNPPPIFQRLAQLSSAELLIAAAVNLLRPLIYEATREGFHDRDRALREEAEQRLAVLRNPGGFAALKAMLAQACPREGDRLHWPSVERLTADYRNVDVPVHIVWGAHDEVLPVSMGFKLDAQLPDARLTIVPDCMHSVHLERPLLSARIIEQFTDRMPTAPRFTRQTRLVRTVAASE